MNIQRYFMFCAMLISIITYALRIYACHDILHHAHHDIPAELWDMIFTDFYTKPQALIYVSREYPLTDRFFDTIAQSFINKVFDDFAAESNIPHILATHFATTTSHIDTTWYQETMSKALKKYITYLNEHKQLIGQPPVYILNFEKEVYENTYPASLTKLLRNHPHNKTNTLKRLSLHETEKITHQLSMHQHLLGKSLHYYLKDASRSSRKIIITAMHLLLKIAPIIIKYIERDADTACLFPLICLSIMYQRPRLYFICSIISLWLNFIKENHLNSLYAYLHNTYPLFYYIQTKSKRLAYIQQSLAHNLAYH